MTTFLQDIDDMLIKNRATCDALKKGIAETTDVKELKVLGTTATMMFETTSEVLGNAAEVIRRNREKGC